MSQDVLYFLIPGFFGLCSCCNLFLPLFLMGFNPLRDSNWIFHCLYLKLPLPSLLISTVQSLPLAFWLPNYYYICMPDVSSLVSFLTFSSISLSSPRSLGIYISSQNSDNRVSYLGPWPAPETVPHISQGESLKQHGSTAV